MIRRIPLPGLVAAMAMALIHSAAALDETAWITGLAESLEKQRSTAQVLDTSRLGTGSRAPVMTLKTQAPAVFDGTANAWSAAPRAGLSVASPGPASSERFSWEFSVGGEVDVRKDSIYDPVELFLGPYISAQTTLRFAPRTKDSLPPGEVLRNIELGGRVRGLDEKALSGFLEVCSLAALSASARADALKARARAEYLEKNLKRMDIMMQGGKISRSDYLEEKDAWERSRATADDAFYESARFGRDARARARPASFSGEEAPDAATGGPSSGAVKAPDHFQAADLESLARRLEPLLDELDPVPAAVESATAGWELRLAELSAEAVAEAPRFTATLDSRLGWNDNDKAVAPIVSGIIGFTLPLGPNKAERSRSMVELKRLKDSVAADAGDAAERRLVEQRILLENRRGRISFLFTQYKENLRLAEVYARLLAQGAVTEIDRLAAVSTLVEVESALDRARAGYFLDTVTAIVNLRIPIGRIILALSTEVGGRAQ